MARKTRKKKGKGKGPDLSAWVARQKNTDRYLAVKVKDMASRARALPVL